MTRAPDCGGRTPRGRSLGGRIERRARAGGEDCAPREAPATLGLVVNLRYPENEQMIAEARRRGAEHNGAIVVVDAAALIRHEQEYQAMLREHRLDGLLVGSLLPATHEIAALASQRRPVVLVGRRIPWLVPSVSGDDEAGVRLAVQHLAALGHRRIAYVGGPGDADTVHLRLEGFRDAMRRQGLELPAGYVTASTPDPVAGPARATSSLLALDPRPTAVVVWTIGDVPGVLHAVRGEGLSVPEDLSLVAINDAPSAAYLAPPLTVVSLQLAEAAGQAVLQLCDAVNGRRCEGDTVIATPPTLITRRSTVPPRVA